MVELSGWGRTPRAVAELRKADEPAAIVLVHDERGQLARGLGRSYGDAALNSGGVVWDTTALTSLEIDDHKALAIVDAGVSYSQLLEECIPRGLFPAVTPGTKQVTIGGAIAADVHGKNHHHDGSIGHHVESLTMLVGNGDLVETKPGDDLFAATVGGMGLTGIILKATLSLFRIDSPLVEVDTFRTRDLAATIDVMTARDHAFRYSVAWVDLAHPTYPGRGVVTLGNHATSGALASWKPKRALATFPELLPAGLVNRFSVRAFNNVWYRKAPEQRSGEPQAIERFFYPLDIAHNWNRLYGGSGFIQYQVVVPFGREDVLERAVTTIQKAPAPPSLAVLKRLGEGRGMLSFPIPGWTLAVDFPATTHELNIVLTAIDEQVSVAGGRVYLAKDSRLSPSLVPAMYPELEVWREVAGKADPQHRFRSDLDRRLRLRC